MNYKSKLLGVLAIVTLLGSCKTPELADTKQHIPTLPEEYRHAQQTLGDSTVLSIGSVPWKNFFKNPTLVKLIDSAITYNVDMQLAVKNIEASQLLLKQAKAGYLPEISARAGVSSTNPSNYSMNGLNLGQILGSNHIEDYSASVGLAWEVDLWGKVKNQNRGALAEYLQTEEAKKLVQTQVVSQVAKGYYQLLLLYELMEIARLNLDLSSNTLNVVQQQYEVGEANLLALEQVHAQKLAAESLIPEFQQQIYLQENALQVLSGHLPQEIKIAESLDDISLPENLLGGVPAELLRYRPDVKQAELAVLANMAYTQSAKAQMYPSLVISAEAGVNALKTSNWFNLPGALFGSVAGSLTQPIFQRRALKTQYELRQIEGAKSVTLFQQSVIVAVGEVSDALVSIQKLKERYQIADKRTQRLRQASKHADILFETGSANYLEVISAQSNVLQTELQLAQIKKDELTAIVDLYRSLGGGWGSGVSEETDDKKANIEQGSQDSSILAKQQASPKIAEAKH